MVKENHALALFDFDGTISNRDSFIGFTKYAVGSVKLYFAFFILATPILLFFMKLLSNHKLKELFFKLLFAGWEEDTFKKMARDFSINELPAIVKQSALDRIRWHKSQGDRVVVVSASIDLWLSGWCEKNDLDLIATEMECVNGEITGNLSTPNCFGPEKVKRVLEKYTLEEFSSVFAYGDSSGDREMLAVSDNPHYRNFN